MKATKKLYTVLLVAFVTVLLLSVSIFAIANSRSEKKTVYKYALLGDTYTVEDEFISGTTPKGESISADTETVYLNWASGSYIFEYENKIVNLKVYESAPADKTELKGEIPFSVPAGKETVFPGYSAESGIFRTDGAPEIGSYSVDAVFWFGGNKVQTVKNVSSDFKFTPREAGLWVLSYEYKDVFGRVRTADYPFTVTNDRIIISSLKDIYYVGGKISSSSVYGFYNGKVYPAVLSIQLPDGSTEEVSGSYTFAGEGAYRLTASVTMEGQSVEEYYDIDVKSGLQSFIGTQNGFKDGVLHQGYPNVNSLTSGSSGLLLDMNSASASFTYNGIIDLDEIGKNTPVISFTPNHTYGGTISKISVTLTDVYNSKNSITVNFSENGDMTETTMSYDNTFVNTTFNGVTTAVRNYYPLVGSSVGWTTTFNTFYVSPSNTNPDKSYPVASQAYAMNFAFDTAENTVYSYGQYHLVEWGSRPAPEGYPTGSAVGWYPIADLEDPTLVTQFGGFTTGEVYLSLKVEAGRGDLMLYSIGNVSFANTDTGYASNSSIVFGGFDGSIPAVLGVPYELPFVENDYITNLSRKLYFGGEEIAFSGNSFIPEKIGAYKAVYEGINQFGQRVSKEIAFECIEKPNIIIDYPIDTVPAGSIYTVKEPTVTGYGNVSYIIYVDGKAVKAGDNVKVNDRLEIKIVAEDMLDTKEKVFEMSIDKNRVSYSVDFPRSATAGSIFKFPTAHIFDYLTGTELAYEIYIEGVKQGESITLPETEGELHVEYRTEKGSEAYVLNIRSETVLDGADALILPEGSTSETNEAGTVVTVTSADSTLKMPYMLSPINLGIQFIVLEEKLNFNQMTVRMTDKNGTSIEISIVKLKNETPELYINGKSTGIRVRKTAQNYTSGVYEGQNYYSFSLEYNDLYTAIINASRVEAYVTSDMNGIAFSGFDGGVYLDFYPSEISGSTAEFIITKVSNQFFSASAFEYGDIVGPALSTKDFFLGNNNVLPGYVLKLSNLECFDVLKANSSIKVTLMSPNGEVIVRDADPKSVADTVLSNVGIYTLKIVADDGDGGRVNISYRFIVEDVTAPEITVSAGNVATASRGDEITVKGASASDSAKTAIKVVAYSPTGKIIILAEGEGSIGDSKLLIEVKGTYKIRYIAEDESGNTSSEVFYVKVEG